MSENNGMNNNVFDEEAKEKDVYYRNQIRIIINDILRQTGTDIHPPKWYQQQIIYIFGYGSNRQRNVQYGPPQKRPRQWFTQFFWLSESQSKRRNGQYLLVVQLTPFFLFKVLNLNPTLIKRVNYASVRAKEEDLVETKKRLEEQATEDIIRMFSQNCHQGYISRLLLAETYLNAHEIYDLMDLHKSDIFVHDNDRAPTTCDEKDSDYLQDINISSKADLKILSKPDLKMLCDDYGLHRSGNKTALMNRLLDASSKVSVC